ncbi:hypothetical protein [Nocardia transvalensis]|uniref:hypothetical protein n=1 Tax=Nocardia transvalensis TaxID=37333 RepID=UPI0018932F26|nr:hypothetical protein [Nocardia transvalensis]MBF6331064.1 hypothetical protein [Nocardia transvalensis]
MPVAALLVSAGAVAASVLTAAPAAATAADCKAAQRTPVTAKEKELFLHKGKKNKDGKLNQRAKNMIKDFEDNCADVYQKKISDDDRRNRLRKAFNEYFHEKFPSDYATRVCDAAVKPADSNS